MSLSIRCAPQSSSQRWHRSSVASISISSLGLIATIAIHMMMSIGSTSARENQSAVLESLRKYDSCFAQAVYGFSPLVPRSNPPTSVEQLIEQCKYQAEGFKCLKDKTRGAPAILRRGAITVASTRQRQNRKYCTNPESEQSKKFINDNKCNMGKGKKNFVRLEDEFSMKLIEIVKRSYNDSATELKYLCCAVMALRWGHREAITEECAHTKETVEYLSLAMVPNDVSLLCDDEEKLVKTCAKLDPIVIPKNAKYVPKPGNSPSALTMFLVATLGEPQDDSVKLDL